MAVTFQWYPPHQRPDDLSEMPEGAFCYLRSDPSFKIAIFYTILKGCVLEDRERNGYDDSDFYVRYWDEASQSIKSMDYNSTRYGGGGSATVDATPEVLAKADRYCHEMAVYAQRSRRNEFAKVLRAYRASMIAAAADHGFTHVELLSLDKADRELARKLVWLLTARIRSGFKAKLRQQAIDWLCAAPAGRKYATPLSRRQLEFINIYGRRKPSRYDNGLAEAYGLRDGTDLDHTRGISRPPSNYRPGRYYTAASKASSASIVVF